MTTLVVVVVAAAVFGWGALSARLERADLTAPIVFVAVGVLIAVTMPLEGRPEPAVLRLLTEVTLVWVLFSDAAKVGLRELRADAGTYARLLGVGLPLTVVLGWLAALAILPGVDGWLALLVGAALAPTDAALGAAVINDRRVPARIRGILNVESGLNDGIVTPVVLIALAGVASEGDEAHGLSRAAVELLVGVAAGSVVGGAGGGLISMARRRGWVDEEFAGPAVLALALLAYAGAVLVHGNGFVAAFVAGIAFGALAGRGGPRTVFYVEQSAGLASLLVWTLFGAVAVPLVVHVGGWRLALYALLSVTVVRMLPVALVLVGSGLGARAALFIGWFGPRGLASVVFGLLAVEDLGGRADPAVAAIATTVLLSVVVHGVTAGPLAARFAAGYRPGGSAAVATPSRTGDAPHGA
ncbi:MAG TPA: cation:proton antiporter [Kineosporiaceae bacterium]|nr:cation:proton antiporter [Kineosporiaceae bacterium]